MTFLCPVCGKHVCNKIVSYPTQATVEEDRKNGWQEAPEAFGFIAVSAERPNGCCSFYEDAYPTREEADLAAENLDIAEVASEFEEKAHSFESE